MAATMRSPNRSARDGQDPAPIQRKSLSTIMEPLEDLNANQAPTHPVPCMQGAFEESIMETTEDTDSQYALGPREKVDSATRRRILLEQEQTEDTHAARWGKKAGERYHPIWKIIAQISFGIHLLHTRMAKSEEDVLNILQVHIDEVDGFLGRTTEDFDLAIEDITERLRCLKLPLEHGEIFDIMLEDRTFRKQIVDGNEKIEHISNRTAAAMNDASRDVQHGLEATRELAKYMVQLDREWVNRTRDQDEVYDAMSGNAEGWFRCFMTLQTKGNALGSSLIQLGGIIAELQKRAGVASRKNIAPQASFERSRSPTSTSRPMSPAMRAASPQMSQPSTRYATPRTRSPDPQSRPAVAAEANSPRPSQYRTFSPEPSQHRTFSPEPSQYRTFSPELSQSRTFSPEPSQYRTFSPEPSQSRTFSPEPLSHARTFSPEPTRSLSRTTSPDPGRSTAGFPPGIPPPVNVQERRNLKEKLLQNKETRFRTHSGNDPRELRPTGSVSAAVDRARSPLGSHQVADHLDYPVRPGSSAPSYMSRNGGPAPSVVESDRGAGGFFKRPSFTKAFSIRRKNPSSSKKSNLGGTKDSSTSLPNHDNSPPVVPYSERDYYFNFLAPSGPSSQAQSPATRPTAASGARSQPPAFSPFAADAARSARVEDSPWSSTQSHHSVTSPEPSTTRSTTPGTRAESPPPRQGDTSHDPTYPLAWPPKAAHLLGATGPAADGPTVKTGPAAPKPQWPPVATKATKKKTKKKHGFVFSPEMEMAFPSAHPSAQKKAAPPVLLDIGPTRRPNPLKVGTDLLKRPFESEKPLLQLFYGDTHKHAPPPY